MLSIYDRVKMLRKYTGLTQEKFAEQADISRSTLALIETGKATPDYNLLNRLCIIYNLNPAYFFSQNEGLSVEWFKYDTDGFTVLNSIPTTDFEKNIYAQRSMSGYKAEKNTGWVKAHKHAFQAWEKVNYYSDRIKDIKLILQSLRINIEYPKGYESDLINTISKDDTGGALRLNFSSSIELEEYINELHQLSDVLEKRFFSFFAILYTNVRKNEPGITPIKKITK